MTNVMQIGEALRTVFGQAAERIAQETGFVQRTSKMSGITFLKTWVMEFLRNPRASLSMLCEMAADLGVEITKQGMQERLTDHAVTFFERMFEHCRETLQNLIQMPLPLLAQFTAIFLVDSTCLSLPAALQDEFPAAGGNGPPAGLKLQVVWEFLRGNLDQVIRQTGRQPDQRFARFLEAVAPGVLFLFDLGYFTLEKLRQVMAGAAYFICRLDTQCVLYQPAAPERFDLLAHLQQSSAAQVELPLWVGGRAKVPCRVLAVRLAPEVVAERQRLARRKAQRKSRHLTAEKLAWLAWNVFITNVPAPMLSFRQVVLLYRLRWQIELLFRLWKSLGELDRIAGEQRERVLCELYAKLIGLLVFHYLTAPIRWAERELSLSKAFKTFQRYAAELAKTLPCLPELYQLLLRLIARWQRFAVKDKRCSRLSTCKQLEEAASCA